MSATAARGTAGRCENIRREGRFGRFNNTDCAGNSNSAFFSKVRAIKSRRAASGQNTFRDDNAMVSFSNDSEDRGDDESPSPIIA